MRSVSLLAGAILCFSTQAVAGFSFEDVPNGTIGATTLFARANSCPSGQYYDNGCKQCPAGSYCTGEGGARQCDKGQYSRAGASACTACPSGTYTDQKGSVQCTTAQCGWYATGSNESNDRGSDGQKQCGRGFYSSPGSTTCKKCPAGSYCNSATTCEPALCQPGRFSANEGASDCTECAAGTYINRYGSTSCCKCCAGSFQSSTGQTHCQACPEQTRPNGQGKVLVTSEPGSKSSQQCHAYGLGDPAPIPGACVDSSVTENQAVCPATTGPVPTGLRKRTVPRGCSNRRHTMCEVKSGRGGWECLDTETTLDACGSCDNDCSAIPYVGDVKCVAGKCQVATCLKGFNVQYVDETPSCIPTTKQAFLIFERDMGLAK
ncbi:Si dkey-21a6.5 [Rhizoctonia solani]|uniref:Si dkey-21a6.5 n=1 Tax=Rhizoctonia solani TaxID=456999 RepID=A0A8H7LLQ1_9AGAM|nr:Si dkey-21a6.5 [Rhizoctonia solani]